MTSVTQPATFTAHALEQIDCSGAWTLSGLAGFDSDWQHTRWPRAKTVVIDGSQIQAMDSAGAWQCQAMIHYLQQAGKQVRLQGFTPEHSVMMDLAATEAAKVYKPMEKRERPGFLYQVGEQTIEKAHQTNSFFEFVGHLSAGFWRAIRQPKRFQFGSIVATIETGGYEALPIIALLSFLIGVVLAYQFGLELEAYGANIFIVNVSGMAILREFAPLVTAIILAGRTSSSFTAKIGMMKVNEEIDALRTMGLSPMERLVMPKIIGMVIALPLLTVWSDIFGILGSMMMAETMLGISFTDFLSRFQEVIKINHYLIGIAKAPVFALLIAAIGCFQGLRVGGSSESVGSQTTRSVVQAIFLIIIADAAFSVVFSWMGI